MSTSRDAITLAAGWAGWPGAGGWTWLWLPFLVPLWLAVGAGAIWLAVRGLGWGGRGGWDHGRAQEILAERYARGELTNEEYRERLEHLHRG